MSKLPPRSSPLVVQIVSPPRWNPDAYHDPKRRLLMPSSENSGPTVPEISGAASDLTILQSLGFGKMQRGKGKGILNEVQYACKVSESRPVVLHTTFESINSDKTSNVGTLSESDKSSSTELGEIRRIVDSVVSITSLYGPLLMCKCTGVFIEIEGLCADDCADDKFILTSASLYRFSDTICNDMWIQVRLPDGKFEVGCLLYCDLESDLAVVSICCAHHFEAVNLSFNNDTQLESNIKAMAFRRCFDSGSLMSSNYIEFQTIGSLLTHDIGNDWIGGPLFDIKGNFAGMICNCAEGTTFLPKNKIVDWLKLDKPIIRCNTSMLVSPSEWHELFDETEMFMQDDPVFDAGG